MIHSTQKNTTTEMPTMNENAVIGKYLIYPDNTGKRAAQGGMRTRNTYKHSISEKPLVTIITVCLNSSKTIDQCIDSVLQQTYENIEYIVIDGGSTDGTVDIIKENEESIDYYVSEPDRGLYHAMNKGLELASGDYILILNSDDWYQADCVDSLIRAKKYSGADFVSSLAQYVDKAGKPIQVLRHMPYDASLRLRMPLRHETMLISSSIYNDIGLYDETYRIIADFHLTIKLFEREYTLYELQYPLLNFRNDGISNTNKKGLYVERFKLVREVFPCLNDEDANEFSELAKLKRKKLLEIAKKYPAERRLVDSLYMYSIDRNKNDNSWKNNKIDWSDEWGDMPLVSVILPVYGAEKTIKACIDSVLAQTLKCFELICINDASLDESQKIINHYQWLDSRVVSLVNDTNIGLGATRNRGVRMARGDYIFHIDPDDTIPSNALDILYSSVNKYGSDMVKGAYISEQCIHGEKTQKKQRKSFCPNSEPIVNVSLKEMPSLLKTTEGHWSYIYRSDFARKIPYPNDLKMGQDSIFLVNALVNAKKVSVIDEIVYCYSVNPSSAMNTFTFRKYMDGLEWRYRAWNALNVTGLSDIGDRLLQVYWSDSFFYNLLDGTSTEQQRIFFDKFRMIFSEAGISSLTYKKSNFLSQLFSLILRKYDDDAVKLISSRSLSSESILGKIPIKNVTSKINQVQSEHSIKGSEISVATFCSMDHGGAGTGTQRRVFALREAGVDAKIYSLVVKSNHNYVKRIVPKIPGVDSAKQAEVWRAVREGAILPVRGTSGFQAKELFSLPFSVVNFQDISNVFDQSDIVHFHWVVGMFDYDRAADHLGNKPVVWTLADMNAFTGGCHYSEGCEEYIRECKKCPLLGGSSDIAHKAWKIKKRVYSKLKCMHIVCPSGWLAECAKKSSLFKNKQIHVIPNAFPIERFSPINKMVARIKLGLPLKKKLILFGADGVKNYRKGSDLLINIIDIYCKKYKCNNIEVITFGNDSLNLKVPTHSLGYLNNESQLSLAYSAADVFVFPSREDNSPLTVGESLLCGTPVVSFPVGNVTDLVSHKENGYIAKYLDCDDMANGILWALYSAEKANPFKLINRCRSSAAEWHDPKRSAMLHIELYSSLL